MRRRHSRRNLLIAAAATVIIAALYFLPTGYVVTTPGNLYPAASLLDPETKDSSILIATQYTRGRIITWPGVSPVDANAFMVATAVVLPSDALTPTSRLLGNETRTLGELLSQTELEAGIVPIVVALRAVDQPFWITGDGVRVLQDHPSGLRRGDIIVGANGRGVSRIEELEQRRYLDGRAAIIVWRDGAQFALRDPDLDDALLATNNPVLRTSTPLSVRRPLPFFGRSADLGLALQAYTLVAEPLAPGCTVAATGTLRPDGTVDAVLEAHSKLYTARGSDVDVFLIPEANRDDFDAADWPFTVRTVSSFREAVEILSGMECATL